MDQLFGVIFGVLLGGFLTFLAQTYYAMREQDVAHLNDFLTDVERIEELCVRYWLTNFGSKSSRRRHLEVQIRGSLHASTVFYETAEKLLGNDLEQFKDLDAQLFDAATGGDFETSQMVSDPETVVKIMVISNQLRGLVRGARRKSYWAR